MLLATTAKWIDRIENDKELFMKSDYDYVNERYNEIDMKELLYLFTTLQQITEEYQKRKN